MAITRTTTRNVAVVEVTDEYQIELRVQPNLVLNTDEAEAFADEIRDAIGEALRLEREDREQTRLALRAYNMDDVI